jgi:hypothetical protein
MMINMPMSILDGLGYRVQMDQASHIIMDISRVHQTFSDCRSVAKAENSSVAKIAITVTFFTLED